MCQQTTNKFVHASENIRKFLLGLSPSFHGSGCGAGRDLLAGGSAGAGRWAGPRRYSTPPLGPGCRKRSCSSLTLPGCMASRKDPSKPLRSRIDSLPVGTVIFESCDGVCTIESYILENDSFDRLAPIERRNQAASHGDTRASRIRSFLDRRARPLRQAQIQSGLIYS